MRVRLAMPLALVLLVTGCSFEHLTATGDQRPSPAECGKCHVEVFEEWSASAHARAYTGETYETLTAGHTFKECLSCHAPDSIYVDGPVEARSVRPHDGVDCVSCHFDGESLVGPLASEGLVHPHPVREQRALYLKSDLCGRCHEASFAQWEAVGDMAPDGSAKRTCQECHMPAVERTVTQATDAASAVIVALESSRPQRRHRFDLSAVREFEGAVDLRIDTRDGVVEVVLGNLLPHSLPTGAFGARTLVADLTWFDDAGQGLERSQLSWSIRLGTAVAPFATDRRRVDAPRGAVRLEVRLSRPDRGSTAGFELARAGRRLP